MISESRIKIYYHDLMTAALNLLAFKLDTEYQENSDYNLNDKDNFSFRFKGYRSYNSKRISEINLVVTVEFNDGLITKEFLFKDIYDKKSEPSVNQIVNAFLEIRTQIIKSIKAFDKIKEIVLQKTSSETKITHGINRMYVTVQNKKYFIETLTFYNTWLFNISGFGEVLLKTESIPELINFISNYEFALTENENSDDDFHYKTNATLRYLASSLDEEILNANTSFRKTFNGLMRLPEIYFVYEDLKIGYVEGHVDISIFHNSPKTEYELKRYSILCFEDYSNASVPSLAALLKQMIKRFLNELNGIKFIVDGLEELDETIKEYIKINYRSWGVEINFYKQGVYQFDISQTILQDKNSNVFKLRLANKLLVTGSPKEILDRLLINLK